MSRCALVGNKSQHDGAIPLLKCDYSFPWHNYYGEHGFSYKATIKICCTNNYLGTSHYYCNAVFSTQLVHNNFFKVKEKDIILQN